MIRRRIALAVMLLVSAWSLWAWARPRVTLRPERPAITAAPALGAPQRPTYESPSAGQVRVAEGNEEKQAATEAADEGPAAINWFDFGSETPPYIAMVINFGIVAVGYYLLGKKPIMAGLRSRRDSIAKEIEDAQRMLREAEDRAKLYQSKLDSLEEEIRTVRDGLVRAGEAERDRIVREAEAKAERMQRDAAFLVEQEVKQIRVELLRDTVQAAVSAAEELLRQRITPADQERLAEDYLSEIAPKRAVAASVTGTGSAGTQETVS